jgi:hypothetical protein
MKRFAIIKLSQGFEVKKGSESFKVFSKFELNMG